MHEPTNLCKIFIKKSMQTLSKFALLLLFITTRLQGQGSEIDRRIQGELKMTFPSIYFKHNSTDYASMPYTADSCFQYIAFNFMKHINGFSIWRDSNESEGLTYKRIRILKKGLNKYIPSRHIDFQSMGKEQKISRHTINMCTNNEQIQYLLSLNSVFDFSKTRMLVKRKWWQRRSHLEGRYLCFACWRRGAFTREYQRLHGRNKQK
jgi:hypothetical protein